MFFLISNYSLTAVFDFLEFRFVVCSKHIKRKCVFISFFLFYIIFISRNINYPNATWTPFNHYGTRVLESLCFERLNCIFGEVQYHKEVVASEHKGTILEMI